MLMVRRNYISDSQKPSGATDAQVALAELLIDQYVGFQPKHFPTEILGQVATHNGASKVITDTNVNSQLGQTDGYLAKAIIEIIGGTGAGEIRQIISSNRDAKSITYTGTALSIDTTSIFKIYQLAKFPRSKDVQVLTPAGASAATYYKTIPQAVQEAVIAQVDFILEMGDDFFLGDDAEMDGESIGNYSYSRGSSGSQSSQVKMVAPKARMLLKGIKNSTGRLIGEDPTCP